MVFYEIELLDVPEIIFACSVDLERYKNRFLNKKDFIEISVCEKGRILFEHHNGIREMVYPGMLLPIFEDIACDTVSYQNERQRHITAGVKVRHHLKRYDSEAACEITALRERMKSGRILLIPYHCYLHEEYHEVIHILKKIILFHSSGRPQDRINAIGQWYLLAGRLTDFVLRMLDGAHLELPPSELIYAEKASRYIAENYMNKLSVQEIAGNLGISEGYLHRIFKNTKGIGVLAYLNQYRIALAIQLMENKNVSLKEAAGNVGIEDPAYMSRLFKKTTGLSCREYFAEKRHR